MFGRLFGSKSNQSPAPPKNHIEVVCPACGAAQYEPRLVVSTFCKKCGVHLTIKKRQVTASNVTRSGMGMAGAWDEAPSSPASAKPAVESKPVPTAPPVHTPLTPVSKDAALSAADGFGAFLQSQSREAETPASTPTPAVAEKTQETAAAAPAATAPPSASEAETAHEPPVESEAGAESPDSSTASGRSPGYMRRPQSNSPPPTAPPPPQTASSLQKMKEQGFYRNQYFKDAECFDCGHKFKTGRSARSASCPSCGAYISLEDVEINMASTHEVKTRGDLLVRKRGHLSTSRVQCRDLNCQGIIEANVSCTGDATFRTAGTIIGEIHCQRFVVEKGADVVFHNPVYATEVEVQARVTGSLYCTGPVLINSNGAVNGDVTARSVSIEPGGELNGAMNIVRGKSPPPSSGI